MGRQRLTSSFAIAASLLLLGTACVREKGATQEGGPTTAQAGGSSSNSADEKQGSSTPKAPGKVVASADTSDKDATLRIDLYELKRTGSVLVLNFGVTNTTPGAGSNEWSPTFFFDDGLNNADGAVQGLASVDGIFIVDEVNKKKYPVARDANKRCLCSASLGSTDVARGQTVTLSATFGAPPSNVKAVNVSIPHVPTFANVPLS